MRKLLKTIYLTVAIIGLSACSLLEKEDYEAPPTELVEFEAEYTPNVVWTNSVGAGSEQYNDMAPWVQNGHVIAVDYEGEVTSFNRETGSEVWEQELDVPVATGVGGGEGFLFVGTQEGEIIALDELTGEQRWKQELSSEVLAPPKVGMGVVVVRTADGKMSGLSKESGAVLWSYQRAVPLLSLRGASAPVIADDKVLAGYANGKLVALSVSDGVVIWEKSIAIPRGRTELDRLVDIDATPVVKNGEVYVVAYNGRVAALSLDDGSILWSHDISSRAGLDVDYGVATYVTDIEDYVWAFQDGTGDALWRQTRLLRRKVTAPTIVGDNVVVGDFEGYLHWLSRSDGRFVARLNVAGDAIRSQIIVDNDLMFAIATDGTLTALRVQ